MKTIIILVIAVMVAMVAGIAQAQDVSASWNQDASGNWSSGGNWEGGNAATGTTGIATFTNTITASRTVTNDSSPWTINGMIFSNTGAFGWTNAGGTLILGGTSPTIMVNPASTATVSSVLSGSAGLIKDGAGTLNLNVNNTFSGGFFIKAGIVSLNSGNGASTVGGSGSITLGDGGDTSVSMHMAGGTSGTSYNNAIVLNGSSASEMTLSFANISISVNGAVSGTGNLKIADSRVTGGLYFGSTINNVGIITNVSAGTCNVNLNGGIGGNVTGLINYSGILHLNSANTSFIGDTTATGGTLDLKNTNALQKSVLKMNGGKVTFGSLTAVALGGLSGSGNINLTNTLTTSVNLTIGNSNASYGGNTLNPTYSGVLSNANGVASLTKVGSNTQILSGTNTYTGDTIISNGTLSVTHANCFPTNTSVYIYSGATNNLNFIGTNTIHALYINGVVKSKGIYGADNLAEYVSGTGYLDVLSGPPSGTVYRVF